MRLRQCQRCLSVMGPRPCIWPARGRITRPRATGQRGRQRIRLRLQPGWGRASSSPRSRPAPPAPPPGSSCRRITCCGPRSSSRRCSGRSSWSRLRRRRLQGSLPREPRSRRRRRRRRCPRRSRARPRRLRLLPGRSRLLRRRLCPKLRLLRNCRSWRSYPVILPGLGLPTPVGRRTGTPAVWTCLRLQGLLRRRLPWPVLRLPSLRLPCLPPSRLPCLPPRRGSTPGPWG